MGEEVAVEEELVRLKPLRFDPELPILSGKQAPEWAHFLAGLDPEHPQADEIFPWEPSQYLGASIGLPLAVAFSKAVAKESTSVTTPLILLFTFNSKTSAISLYF